MKIQAERETKRLIRKKGDSLSYLNASDNANRTGTGNENSIDSVDVEMARVDKDLAE